ncbi:MAG: histidine kinase [Flavobacteriaceae bacterium]|nr:histidine kinase [Flavobacteriaceae bacterium]
MYLFKKNIVLLLVLLNITCFAQQESYTFYNKENGFISDKVSAIAQDTIGYLWIGTEKGLFKFDGDDFKKVNSKVVTFLSFQNNKLWVGCKDGLLIIDSNETVFYESKQVNNILIAKNEVYVSTNKGVHLLKENYLQPLKISSTIDFEIVNTIIQNNTSFYVGTNSGLYNVDNLKQVRNVNKILDDEVNHLLKFNNSILVCTSNQLKKLDNKIIKDVIAIPNISNIKRFENVLWITSTKNGVSIYNLPSFTFSRKINKYNQLTTNNVGTVFTSINSNFWLGLNNGLYNIQKADLKEQVTTPTLFIEDFSVNYSSTNKLHYNNNIELSSNENTITISYKTVDLRNPKSIQYRYSINKNISNWSTNNQLQLANLNFGTYKIELQSKVKDKKSPILNINFTISAPFYYNTYFIILVFILFLFVIYLLVNYNLNKIRRKNSKRVKELELKNEILSLQQQALQLQMNPHFIFNVLNSIKALGNSGKLDEFNKGVTQFSNLLRSILHNSKKEEISLKEELNNIKNYLDLEKRISSKDFTYQIDLDTQNIDKDEILIPTMLIQPFLENSIKHGFTNSYNNIIKVSIKLIANFIKFKIIDNGIGFSQSKNNKVNLNNNSLALNITKERIQALTLQHEFNISDIKTNQGSINGTQVSFKIPLKTEY